MSKHGFPSITFSAMVILFMLAACNKEDTINPDPPPPFSPTITTLQVEHHVDGDALVFNDFHYTTAVGHTYSVSRIEYYLSQITFIGTNGTQDLILPGPFYVNGNVVNSFDLGILSAGEYSGATALLGLDQTLNVTGALPGTAANINMAWPEPMGGGYHFLKFEGHFLNNGSPTGYAMHLGGNENLPTCSMSEPFSLDGDGGGIVLRFNLNQVFREPHSYDLSTGNYSMGSSILMGLLRDNCANAFSIDTSP